MFEILIVYTAVMVTVNFIGIAILSQRKYPPIYKTSEPIDFDEDFQMVPGKIVQRSKGKGAVFFPPTEEEEAREAILQRNKEQGVDTPIKELYPNENEEITS